MRLCVCVGGDNSRASLAASLSARAPGRGSLRAPDAAASAKNQLDKDTASPPEEKVVGGFGVARDHRKK